MENVPLLANEQFGAVHQINRITNRIKYNKCVKQSTGLILLDVEKAFDTVWHNGLIYKLMRPNMPRYLWKIIADFLNDRTFVVEVNNALSSTKHITAGLPQGSMLSPLLYSIFTSDFTSPKYIQVAYYVDDTTLITSSKLTKVLLKKMENSFFSSKQ